MFNNYVDDTIGPVVYAFLQEFCGLEDNEKITNLVSITQWYKIDITIWFETDKAKYGLLEKYNNRTESEKERKLFKIYYKTG